MTYDKILAMVAAVAVVGSGIAIATPALAQNGKPVIVRAQPVDGDVPTRRVSYRDLNLASAADQTTLNQRVRKAVNQVCFEATGPTPMMSIEWTCRTDSWRRARPQIDLAIQRSKEIAATGFSNIPPVAIAIVAFE